MVHKYFEGNLPAPGEDEELDRRFIDRFPAAVRTVDVQMNELAFNKALQTIWELISAANKYIDETAPWALAKDEERRERLGTVMYNLIEAVRLIALLIAPFMPETAAKTMVTLGGDPEALNLEGNDGWGALQPGTPIAKATPLFPRIEAE
jgi:methionyl-tRNA synthetase